MNFIDKRKEPKSLTTYKAKAGASFSNLPKNEKEDLQISLSNEQYNICAYCLERISSAKSSPSFMGIEHYKPQSIYPILHLDYNNLLGVCQGTGNRTSHCDKSKGNLLLKIIDPLKKNTMTLIKFLDNGKIVSSPYNEDVENDINSILNLNEKYLVENRKNLIKKLKEEYKNKVISLKSKPAKTNFISTYKTYYSTPQSNGLAEYNRVALDWLNKR